MNKEYILNKETSKIELHFTKVEYQELKDEQKKLLKHSYLFSGKAQAWVSRSKNNHYTAIETAKKLGFIEGESIGQRLSYEEEINNQVEKAEARTEKYEQYAINSTKKAEQLQSEFNSHRGDIAFLTQPYYNNAGGRAFKNYSERIMKRYGKGFEEYRKSEYFQNKAATSQNTADMSKFKDRVYLDNRIKECNKNIKAIEKNIVYYEENNKEEEMNLCIEKVEYEIDKLAYLENCIDLLGGVKNSKDNIKVGYLVKIRGSWDLVIKANKTT